MYLCTIEFSIARRETHIPRRETAISRRETHISRRATEISTKTSNKIEYNKLTKIRNHGQF